MSLNETMKEEENQSQIHQRNVPPTVLPTTKHNNQHPMSSSPQSNVQNNNQIMPTVWQSASTFPPPYPPPWQFGIGHEGIYYPNQTQNWAIGLCDCLSDLKLSFLVLLCPCVAFGKIAEIVNEGETIWTEPGALYCFLYIVHLGFMEILDYIGFLLFNKQCIGSMGYQGCIIGFILATFYNGLYRTKMRRQWHLKGSVYSDYGLHLFCHPCALCQQYRQLEHQGFIVFQGWKRNKERHIQEMTMYPQVPPMTQEMSR